MIRILPLEQIKACSLDVNSIIKELNYFSGDCELNELIGEYSVFESGKSAIRGIFDHLKLNRDDEVFITTSSDTTYVTTCVSATIFNYCKISRVLTDRTKAIFVIHTFGFPNEKLFEYRKIADERNIPLIEDCISAFDSYYGKIRLGSVGDYAVYSLPKIFPIEFGGILSSKKYNIKGLNSQYLDDALKLWVPLIDEIKRRRVENYIFLQDNIGVPLYQLDSNINPFMYGFFSNDFTKILQSNLKIEFGLTHVKGEVHIPVNPFINKDDYFELINFIKGL